MKKIELWKENIPLGNVLSQKKTALASAIIKKMYPRCSEEMQKGAIYSHYGLTTVFESVDYAFEYLVKQGFLKPEEIDKNFGDDKSVVCLHCGKLAQAVIDTTAWKDNDFHCSECGGVIPTHKNVPFSNTE
jgi:ribosomal protein S26